MITGAGIAVIFSRFNFFTLHTSKYFPAPVKTPKEQMKSKMKGVKTIAIEELRDSIAQRRR